MEIVSYLKSILKKKKIDYFEIVFKNIKKQQVEVFKANVENLKTSEENQISIRILKNKKIGFTYLSGNNFIYGELEKLIDNVISSLNIIDEDPYYTINDSDEICNFSVKDDKITNLTQNEMIDYSKILEEEAYNFDRRIKIVKNSGLSKGEIVCYYTNSNNSEKYFESNFIGASIVTVSQDENESFMGYESVISRKFDLNFIKIAQNAANKAIRMFGAKKGSSMKVPVIFENELVADILSLISSSFYLENIDKNKSLFFNNKIGDKVANKIFTLIDDGKTEYLNGSVPFDDEGIDTSKKYILKDGILKSYLNNLYYSKKYNTQPTGNGFKPSFKSQPSIAITNFILEKGKKSLDEGIKSINKGIYLTNLMGLHMANTISGDFSLGAEGIIIENGELKYPVKEFVITGNLRDILQNTNEIFNNVKASGTIYSPSILVEGLSISG